MALEIVEIHRRDDDRSLNTEWVLVHNKSEETLSLRGCEVKVAKPHARKSQQMAKLDPGFKLEPDARRRLVAGNPQAKSQGTPPGDDVENYFMFMKAPLLERDGITVLIMRGQMTLARAVFDSKAVAGVGKLDEK